MPVSPPPGSKKVYEGISANVYRWNQRVFDGRIETYECTIRPDAVTVIPFLDRQTVLITKQQHAEKPEPFWDIPGGRVDTNETLEQAAMRELHEETGYRAGRSIEAMHRKQGGIVQFEQAIYIATDLILDPNGRHQDGGERIEIIPTKWDDVITMCLKKQLRQSEVMLAFLCMHFDPEQRAKLDAFLSGQS